MHRHSIRGQCSQDRGSGTSVDKEEETLSANTSRPSYALSNTLKYTSKLLISFPTARRYQLPTAVCAGSSYLHRSRVTEDNAELATQAVTPSYRIRHSGSSSPLPISGEGTGITDFAETVYGKAEG